MARSVRVLCLSPGIASFGWSVIDYNPASSKTSVVRFGTLVSSKLITSKSGNEATNKFGKDVIGIELLGATIIELVTQHSPQYIVTTETSAEVDNAGATVTAMRLYISVLLKQQFDMALTLIGDRSIQEALPCGRFNKRFSLSYHLKSMSHINFKQKRHSELITDTEARAIIIGISFINTILPNMRSYR